MAMAQDDVRIDGHRIIGTYSSTDEVDYVNDDRNRRFYLDPGNEFNFNYEEAFEGYTTSRERANVELPKVGEKYKWMRDHRQVLIDNGILDTDQSRLNVDFVSDRNVLCGILKFGGQQYWHIELAVTLYKGTYHFCKTKDKAERQDEGARLRAASSRLLLKYVTSMDGLTPDEAPVPANENERFFALTTVNCGNHSLLVRGEIQAEKRITPDEPPPALPSPRNCLNVRSREKDQHIKSMKALAWWAPNKIAGIPETRYGLRDDERRTIQRIATIQTDRLATSRFTENRWDPGVCIRTMDALLSQIKELVPEDDPNSFKRAVLTVGPNRTFEIRERLEEDRFVRDHEIRCIYEGDELHTRASGSSSSSPEPESIALPTSDDRSLQSWKVTEETTLPCSSPSLPDDTEPEFPDKLSSSFKEDMPDGYFCEGEFDSKGGVMTVSSHTMTIPPGALDTQTPVKITMKVLRDVPSDILLQDDETVVTYGFWCLPCGLRFAADKPVTLTIPHCAKLIDPHSIQTVLYSWSHNEKEGDETVKPERIQTPRTCRVTPHNIEISLEHFSGGFFAFLRSWLYMDGKVMSVMPFLPKMMPIFRKLMMELRMVNKPHGTSWKDLHVLDKTARYQPAKDDDDEMVVEDEDLQVSLKLEDNIPINKDVKSELLNRTNKHTEYFDLDLNDRPDDSLVILKLKQSTLEMDIQFRTQFSEERDHSASESALPYQISTIGSLDTTTSDSVDEASENLNEISDLDLVELAQQLGNHVTRVALNLGFSHDRWKQFSDMNRDGSLTGTMNMLFDWKRDTLRELQRPSLREALKNSKCLALAETI